MPGATLQWLLFRREQLLMALLIRLAEVLTCQGLVRWLRLNWMFHCFGRRLTVAKHLKCKGLVR